MAGEVRGPARCRDRREGAAAGALRPDTGRRGARGARPAPRGLTLLAIWPLPLLVFALAGLLLTQSQPSLEALPAALIRGATALRASASGAIRPDPSRAAEDVAPPLHEGCMVGIEGTRSHQCLYGDPRGHRTVILFGDSHALQYFAAAETIAKRSHWRLLVLTKRECTPASVPIQNMSRGTKYTTCGTWRRAEMKRIEASGGAVVLSGDSAYTAYGPHGEALRGKANARALEAGYVSTLTQIRGAGLGAVVIRDAPPAPGNIPDCVVAHLHHPGSCDFRKPHNWDRGFDARAARKVAGTILLDPSALICPHGLCRAVIGSVLVYRDNAHLTNTFAGTLVPWLEPALRASLDRRRSL